MTRLRQPYRKITRTWGMSQTASAPLDGRAPGRGERCAACHSRELAIDERVDRCRHGLDAHEARARRREDLPVLKGVVELDREPMRFGGDDEPMVVGRQRIAVVEGATPDGPVFFRLRRAFARRQLPFVELDVVAWRQAQLPF